MVSKLDFGLILEGMRASQAARAELEAADPGRADRERAQQEAEWDRRQAEISAESRAKRLESSGVVAELSDSARAQVIANTMPPSEPLTATLEWLANPERKPCLVLSGRTGTGKTVACAAAIATRGGVFKSADDTIVAFASMFGPESAERERMLKAGLLVIDDVSTEADSGRMQSALTTLLSKRASATTAPTILTLNMTAKAFRERYDSERLMSRFAESVQWVTLANKEDLRRQSKKG